MINLIFAGLFRMFRSKGLYAASAFSVVTAVFALDISKVYYGGMTPSCDLRACDWLAYLPFSSAIIVCFFCAEDYEGGAIRSKITVGFSKAKIYLSNYAVCTVGTLTAFLFGAAAVAVMALKQGMAWISSPVETAYIALTAVAVILTSSAIPLIFSMLIERKNVATVTATAVTVAVMAISFSCSESLQMLEYKITGFNSNDTEFLERIDSLKDYDAKVEVAKEYGFAQKSFNYVGGAKRAAYYSSYAAPSALCPILYSALSDADYLDKPVTPFAGIVTCMLFSALITAAGAAVFERKNTT